MPWCLGIWGWLSGEPHVWPIRVVTSCQFIDTYRDSRHDQGAISANRSCCSCHHNVIPGRQKVMSQEPNLATTRSWWFTGTGSLKWVPKKPWVLWRQSFPHETFDLAGSPEQSQSLPSCLRDQDWVALERVMLQFLATQIQSPTTSTWTWELECDGYFNGGTHEKNG